MTDPNLIVCPLNEIWPSGAAIVRSYVRVAFGLAPLTLAEAAALGEIDGVGGVSGGLLLWDFGANSYQTLLGVDVAQAGVGPARVEEWVVNGRFFHPDERHAVVVDRHFAAFFSLQPGMTREIGGQSFTVVGVVEVPGGNQAAAANFYLPLADTILDDESLRTEWVMNQIKPLMEDDTIKKYAHAIKHEIIVLKRYGIILKGITCDTMIASYLLNPSRHSHSLEDLALEYFDHKMTPYKELVGTGKKEIPFDQVETERAMNYGCERVHLILKATEHLQQQLHKEGFDHLFYQVELPLLAVLASMEMSGVKIDTGRLHDISLEFEGALSTLREKIYQLAGETFNINSPQQLGKILFEKLQLPGAKKTKTGFSTDVAVLTKLAQSHPLPAEVLGYRRISKLKSTYVDALPHLVNPVTGRIHTSYNQTVTATGRLSSSNPNLQNIPIRSVEGRKIREAFIAEKGCTVLSADYSQIELRVLAHLSQDPLLMESFRRNEDIHTRTAAEIFGLMPDLVSQQMRREAKVINFGIIYGMSSFGLAKELGVSPKAAGAFIENYFKKYKGVKIYLDRILKDAQKQYYVSTLMKRRRYIPEINSKNMTVRQFAERTAINAPIQGTAADLIKIAMLTISEKLKQEQLKAKMIIQVHDELVFEVPEQELDTVTEIVRKEMENVVEMTIPLKVETHCGKTWNEAH